MATKKEWELTDEEMRAYFEVRVPEEQRNELFNILVYDYMTELQMIAKAQTKKLLKYLDNKGLLIHAYPFHDYADCEACKLLKEVGI